MTLGINEDTIKDIRRGILVRNIGKLTIDDPDPAALLRHKGLA